MKKLLLTLVLLLSLNSFSQKAKELIKGIIEIDGHLYKNNQSIYWEATLSEVNIFDSITKNKYIVRKCETNYCRTVHLTNKTKFSLITSNTHLINNYHEK